MGIQSILYKLGSPYDAYVSHVSELNSALGRLHYLSERSLGYEAGLQSSVRLVPGGAAPKERAQRFRERLGQAAASMSDEEFEDFLSHLGGGEAASVEANRANVVDRMSSTARGLEDYFGIAGRALATLVRPMGLPKISGRAARAPRKELTRPSIWLHIQFEGIRLGGSEGPREFRQCLAASGITKQRAQAPDQAIYVPQAVALVRHV